MISHRSMGVAALLGVIACLAAGVRAEDQRVYRMCVPQQFYQDCVNLLKDPSEAGIQMECVSGRDRIECLDMINQRKADVLATEPEDMYVAYHTKNQDYRVISEIRTKEDKDAEFRYEGIILVKKSSPIHSLKELRGAKSCHTGFGRNVGYKIPVTKLKKTQVLKVSMDPTLTATERELKALSEFFSESCLVGTYSPYPENNRALKKKYPNLCALCENPAQCDYPDKYSGYDGAIRCVDKGKGDVAFSKVQYIKKYFGLTPGTTAEGDPSQFEYLCEDGSRRPVTGPACSWAQRPWTGYISNADTVSGDTNLHNLQHRLEKFFENGLHAENKEAAKHLLIYDNAVYHSKPKAVEPKEYLERAGYKEVIERDGSAIRKMKMCVHTELEMSKCEAMHRAAYSRDIRPEIECVQEKDCLQAVKEGKADLTATRAANYAAAREAKLEPIITEIYAEGDVYVAVIDPSAKKNLRSLPLHFDKDNERARQAAEFFNKRRGESRCYPPSTDTSLAIVHSCQLDQQKNKLLVCPNMETKPVTEVQTCNFEADLPVAIFIRESMTPIEKDTVKHLFVSLTGKFGRGSWTEDVFKLFGQYLPQKVDVLFHDNATAFTPIDSDDHAKEQIYNQIQCDANAIKKV